MRDIALRDLRGENAFLILGTIGRLLKQLDRALDTRYATAYREDATSGDYEHLLAVSERYALDHLQTTLQAREGDLTEPVSVSDEEDE